MDFQPINDDHAVEFVEFAIGFSAPLPGKVLSAIHASHGSFDQTLPAEFFGDLGDDTEFLVPLIQGRNSVSVNFANLRPNGSAVWAARASHNEILITCSRYTRWGNTWPVALEVLMYMLRAAAEVVAADDKLQELVINSMALRVTDRFEGETEQYDLSNTLKRGSYVAEHIFSAGSLWHCNSGWFDSDADGQILSNLNIDTRRVQRKEFSLVGLGIIHKQQFRMSEVPVRVGGSDDVYAALDKRMTTLHANNKTVLSRLLSNELSQRIQLFSVE